MLRLFPCGAVAAAVLVLSAAAGAAPESFEAHTGPLAERFTATKPEFRFRYDVVYRLLGLELRRVAAAEIRVAEGLWRNRATGEAETGCLLDAAIRAGTSERDRLYMRDRMVVVMRQPGLETRLYVRVADQVMNPFLRGPRTNRHYEVYNLESGGLEYVHRNHVTGESRDELPGGTAITAQSRTVSDLLVLLADVYHGRRDDLEWETSPRIFVDIDGRTTPFAVRTSRGRAPVPARHWRRTAIRAEVRPAPEAEHASGRLSVWALPLGMVAQAAGNTDVPRWASDSLEWSMVPLVLDYNLLLGQLRGRLSELEVGPVPAGAEPVLVCRPINTIT